MRVERGLRVPCVAMRRVLVSTVLVTAVSVLAACGSSTPPSSNGPTATATLAPTVAPTPTATPVPTPTPTATPPIPCMPGQFDIAMLNTQGAAGTIYATFEIRNSTTSDCTENGYAKLQMLGSGGALLNTSWTNDSSMASPGPVDLPSGTEPLGAAGASGHGYFLVSWTDATCSQAQAETPKFWQVTLPTSGFQTDVTDIDTSMVCSGAIKVGPIKSAPYT
jgi:hypothetical protein